MTIESKFAVEIGLVARRRRIRFDGKNDTIVTSGWSACMAAAACS